MHSSSFVVWDDSRGFGVKNENEIGKRGNNGNSGHHCSHLPIKYFLNIYYYEDETRGGVHEAKNPNCHPMFANSCNQSKFQPQPLSLLPFHFHHKGRCILQ